MDDKKQTTDYEFDFENKQPQNEGAPSHGGVGQAIPPQKPKNRSKRMGWWACLIAVSIVASYFVGFFSYRATLDEEMRSLAKAKEAIQSLYYDEVTDEEFYRVLFDAVNNEILDDYSQYMTADEFTEFTAEGEGEWSGLGLYFSTVGENGEAQMLITQISGNSPAEDAGLTEGSYLVGFGEDENSLQSTAVFDEFAAFIDEKEKDEEFWIVVEKEGVRDTLCIAKTSFVENYVYYRTNAGAYRFTGDTATELTAWENPLSALDGDTAYIKLALFNGNAATQFKKAMAKFKADGKKHLVLDLRANGGGYMDILQEIASYLCKNATDKKPVIATAKDKNGNVERFVANGNYFNEYFGADSKIKLLADSGTASASECLIGCMIDYGTIDYTDICLSERGGIAKTYGKGIMQTTYPFGFLGKVDAIKLTTAKIFWPVSERCIHGVGVLPSDGCFTTTETYEKDAELLSALSLLGVI